MQTIVGRLRHAARAISDEGAALLESASQNSASFLGIALSLFQNIATAHTEPTLFEQYVRIAKSRTLKPIMDDEPKDGIVETYAVAGAQKTLSASLRIAVFHEDISAFVEYVREVADGPAKKRLFDFFYELDSLRYLWRSEDPSQRMPHTTSLIKDRLPVLLDNLSPALSGHSLEKIHGTMERPTKYRHPQPAEMTFAAD